MNAAIVENWNKVVGKDDICYVLGDIMLNNNEIGLSLLRRLNGNIHIIAGNHDSYERICRYATETDNVLSVKWADVIHYKKHHFFLSHYPALTGNWDLDKPFKARVINLCGHLHCQNKFINMGNNTIYHVELDCQDNMPIEINQIIEDIKYFCHLSIEEQKEITSMEKYTNGTKN